MTSVPESGQPPRESGSSVPEDGHRKGLLSASFFGLLCLQFLTVLNDNTYRWMVTPLGYKVLGPEHKSFVLTLGIACFAVPYILLVAPAGYLADRFSKRTVMAGCMLLQAGIIVFGMGSILILNAFLVFTALAVMGAQGALLGPARLGTIPETVREERISAANGLMGMASVLAAVVGSVLGNALYVLTGPYGRTRWWISGGTMLGIALLGWGASLLVIKKPAVDPGRAVPTHVFSQTVGDLKVLAGRRDLLGAAAASAFLWFLAALAQVNVYLLATTTLDINQAQVGPLLAVLAGGVAAGSVLAGVWSASEVDPGLTPIGAAGIVVACVMMFLVPWIAPPTSWLAYFWSCGGLFLMGTSAGVYDIPLRAYLQDYSPQRFRGEILAAADFLVFAAMLVASGVFWVATSWLRITAPEVFLIAGIVTAVTFFVILSYVRRQTVEAVMRPLHRMSGMLRGRLGS